MPFMLFFSKIIKLLIIMDPIGNMPIFLAVTKKINKQRRTKFVFKELGISLFAMLLILYTGRPIIYDIMQIPNYAIYISGGIVLFLIGHKTIFSGSESFVADKITDEIDDIDAESEPSIFPLAVPMTVGPGTIIGLILLINEFNKITASAITFIAWIIYSLVMMSVPLAQSFVSENKGILKGLDFAVGFLIIMSSISLIFEGIHLFKLTE